MTKGKLIIIEGLDRSGKQTQSEMLTEYLRKKLGSYDGVRLESFPNYKTATGKAIRKYLDGRLFISQKTVNLLYSANRYERMQWLNNRLSEGCIVVLDRYYYSNMAYGSFSGETMKEIEYMDCDMPPPDLVFIIDIEPEITQKRNKHQDINERNLRYIHQVRHNYKTIYFDRFRKEDWFMLNGLEDKQEIHEQIVAIVEDRLFKK